MTATTLLIKGIWAPDFWTRLRRAQWAGGNLLGFEWN